MIAVYAEFGSAEAKTQAVVILHRLTTDENNPLSWLFIRYGDDDPSPGSNPLVIKIELQSARMDDDIMALIQELGPQMRAQRITESSRQIYLRAA